MSKLGLFVLIFLQVGQVLGDIGCREVRVEINQILDDGPKTPPEILAIPLPTASQASSLSSVSRQVGANSSLAKVIPGAEPQDVRSQFGLADRVIDQLSDSRLGSLAGKLDIDKLNQLLNSPNAQRFLDTRSGHINVVQLVEDKLIRITVTSDDFKIISVGPIRNRNIINSIERGIFIPLK